MKEIAVNDVIPAVPFRPEQKGDCVYVNSSMTPPLDYILKETIEGLPLLSCD